MSGERQDRHIDITGDGNVVGNESFAQVVKASGGGTTSGIQQIAFRNVDKAQVINVYVDADAERLREKLTSLQERRWQEQYESLRIDVNAGYAEVVCEPILQIITEVNDCEADGTPVNTELKAKIYRLAAVAHLPYQTGGDAELCADLLTQAQALSAGDGLIQCRVTQALLSYEDGNTRTALDILSGLATDEAIRLRFVIYLETGCIDECRQMIEDGVVDPDWSQTNADWARAFMGYYTVEGRRQDAESVLAVLIERAPSASNYRVAAHSMARFAYARMWEFCSAHDMFPDFHLGLELGELIDTEAQARAAGLFAEAAHLYQRRGCERDAVQMFTEAIRLSIDGDCPEENLTSWILKLAALDPHNPLIVALRQPEHDPSDKVGKPPTILDLAPLLADPTTEPLYILRAATVISNTPAKAAEVASILEREAERFRATDSSFAQYVFVVLELWHTSGDSERALTWLEQSTPSLPHPRLEPLYYIWLHSNQGDFEPAKTWLERALNVAPRHPEALAAAVIVYHQLGNHRKKLECAHTLFETLRTAQTAIWYLNALWNPRNLETLLEVLDSVQDLPLDETLVRGNRARTLLALNRGPEAREDLEWLRDNNAAGVSDLIALAWIYNLLTDVDKAIEVLRACIEEFPDVADAYLYLSQTYLLAGRRGECFEWVLKARQRFPDNPHVSSHLLFFGYPTGKELHPQVSDAWRAFLPGGKFADQSPFIPFTLEEFLEWARPQQEGVPEPEVLYRAGQISRMMLCTLRNVPMFLAHQEANAVGEVRYVADSEQLEDVTRLAQDHPRQVVLDYSALLTLWSLFDANTLSYLSRRFDRIWLPETLRMILLGEQDRMSTIGQQARYEANCIVRDALNAWADKVTVHPRMDPEADWDVTGHHTDVVVAERESLIHFNEHIPPSESPPRVPTIGIAVLADVLYQAGEIDPLTAQRLREHARLPVQEDIALRTRLERERQVVAGVSTLVTWAMRYGLEPILRYFEHVHLSEPAQRRLQAEISDYEFHQQALESLRSLRPLLRQGEEDGLIQFGTIQDEERIIRQLVEERQISEQAQEQALSDFDSSQRLLFDYLDELLGIAFRHDIPIWTDDRWTKKLRLEHRQPRYCFGTDAFLALAHQYPGTTEPLSAEEYHTHYDQLVTWRYCFLPINANHILWHLQQGRDPEIKPLGSLLRHYRERLIELWKLSDSQPRVDEQLGVQLLGLYNQQLVDTLRKLYGHDVSTEVSGKIFAALDLSRHAAPKVLGREPLFFTSLFIHAITSEPVSDAGGVAIRPPSDQALEYSHWLETVIIGSGVAYEVVEEAWYHLVRYPLAMLDEAQTELDCHVALTFLDRMLKAVSSRVAQYLLSTDIGPRLHKDFGLQIDEQVFFHFGSEAGDEMKIYLPAQEWQRDYDQALTDYLADPSVTTVSTGLVTLKIQPVARGSAFLIAEEIPTVTYSQHPDARGVTRYLYLLPGFISPNVSHREALWWIGLQALECHQASTDIWNFHKESLLASGQKGVQTGNELRQHLLGVRPIVKEYFAQAVRLAPSNIVQLLAFIEPTVVLGWLAMPALDWSSGDGLGQWAEQIPLQNTDDESLLDLVGLLDRFGRSIFPDALAVRRRALAALDGMSSPSEQCRVVEQLLSFAEAQSSLVVKANTVLVLYEWLCCSDGGAWQLNGSWYKVGERITALVTRVLQGRASEDVREAMVAALEVIICRWLYHIWAWSVPSGDRHLYELAYLASVGASHIADALAVDGQISQQATQSVIEILNSDLKTRLIISGIEPQPDGFFRPVWGIHLNYAVSYLLKGLVSDKLPSSDFLRLDPSTKEAALVCGVQHRREQAFCCPVSPDPSWLDTELAVDIGATSAAFLGQLGKSELETWPEQERNQLLFAASPDSATVVLQAMVTTIPELDNEAMVMQRVLWLFQGRSQPTPTWFELLRHLFAPEVLDKLREFGACYGEVMWRLGDLLLHPGEDCPPELLILSRELVFEAPVGENVPALVKIKAHVLSQLVGLGLDVGSVCQWLRDVAQSDQVDIPVARSALRPFILFWSRYSEEVRRPLFDAFMEIAQLPEYKGLWEFARLARHQRALSTGETSSDLESPSS